jgi:hypothetical protein
MLGFGWRIHIMPLIVVAIFSFGLRAGINARHIRAPFQLRGSQQLAVSGRLRAQTGRLYPAIHSGESQMFWASDKSEKKKRLPCTNASTL